MNNHFRNFVDIFACLEIEMISYEINKYPSIEYNTEIPTMIVSTIQLSKLDWSTITVYKKNLEENKMM